MQIPVHSVSVSFRSTSSDEELQPGPVSSKELRRLAAPRGCGEHVCAALPGSGAGHAVTALTAGLFSLLGL